MGNQRNTTPSLELSSIILHEFAAKKGDTLPEVGDKRVIAIEYGMRLANCDEDIIDRVQPLSAHLIIKLTGRRDNVEGGKFFELSAEVQGDFCPTDGKQYVLKDVTADVNYFAQMVYGGIRDTFLIAAAKMGYPASVIPMAPPQMGEKDLTEE